MIRALVVSAALCAFLCAACTALAGTGDVNSDSKVTTADAVLALKYAGGLLKPTAAQQFAADIAPAAPDGVVNVADAVRIARIALGVEPSLPVTPIAADFTLTVSGNASPVFTLPGAFAVSGTLRDASNAVFTGSIAFRETSARVMYGPYDLDPSGGAFYALLPAGTYQPIAITHRQTQTANGEVETSDAAVAVGSPIAVTSAITGLALKRPAIASPSTVTFNFSGPSKPNLTTAQIHLTDAGDTAATYGLNRVYRDVAFTPAAVGVPNAVYYVDEHSQYALSSGIFEDLYISYFSRLTVSGAVSRTLAFPTLAELNGVVTTPDAGPPLDLLVEAQPVSPADVTAAYVFADSAFSSYLVAIPSGPQRLRIGLTSPFAETSVYFLLTYTMPATSTATKNITVPSLPAFRTITGTVRGQAGAGLAGATVTAVQVLGTVTSTGVFAFSAQTTTGANGVFMMRLPNGTYTVNVTPA